MPTPESSGKPEIDSRRDKAGGWTACPSVSLKPVRHRLRLTSHPSTKLAVPEKHDPFEQLVFTHFCEKEISSSDSAWQHISNQASATHAALQEQRCIAWSEKEHEGNESYEIAALGMLDVKPMPLPDHAMPASRRQSRNIPFQA